MYLSDRIFQEILEQEFIPGYLVVSPTHIRIMVLRIATDYHRFDQQYPIFVFGGPSSTPTALNNPRYFGLFYAEDFLIDEAYTYHSQLGSSR